MGWGRGMRWQSSRRCATPRSRNPALTSGSRSGSPAKAKWRGAFDDLMAKLKAFGPVAVAPTDTYISLLKKGKKFAIVQVTGGRLDIGVKLKGADPTERFESAEGWNSMVTHRLRVTDPAQIDDEALAWLRRAYDAA